jgi:hypothetical protein
MVSLSEADKDFKALKQDFIKFQTLVRCVDESANKEKLITKVDTICNLLKEVETEFENAKSSFEKMAQYFGESSTSTSTELLFGILDDFLKDLSKAKVKYNKKHAKQVKPGRRK